MRFKVRNKNKRHSRTEENDKKKQLTYNIVERLYFIHIKVVVQCDNIMIPHTAAV